MTARDETIQAMLSVAQDLYDHDWWALAITEMVDAIPPNVLARLAIESGGLEPDGSYWSASDTIRSGVFYEDETLPDDAQPLYRMVKP